MARNRHGSPARPDSATAPFSSVHHERPDGAPYGEQQQQPPLPSSTHQDGAPWASSLQSSSVPRGYPAECYVSSQHHQHPACQQHSSSSVGRHHPSAGWSPPSRSTASAQGNDSAERAVTDLAFPAPRPMQLMRHSGLAVLNAEQYDDGRGRGGGPGTAGPAAPRKAPQHAESEEPAPKKRGRGPAEPAARAGEPGEDKKRTRGRPRLESTSETPQERRRTQIRLAQRAYRDRKEGAISTLEKEVEDLKAENQKVTQAYQELLARVGGSLDEDPGAIAKRPARDDHSAASDSPSGVDAPPAKRARRDGGTPDGPPSAASSSATTTAMTMATTGPMQHPGQAAAPQPTPLWAGVIVTHEPLMPPSASSYLSASVGPEFFGGEAAAPGGYEVLAQATPQNASFAPALAFDPGWPLDGGPSSSPPWAWAGGGGPPAAASAPLPLFPPLPPAPPASFAHQEATFGRRLHRTLLQRAARLATMAHPPPAALARVFGFAMLFESLDQIRARTLALLAPAERASLFEDRYPFQNLGGAGSPVDRDPYAMGPMDLRVAKIRDTLVSLGGQIALPGFDGIFWDPEEVDFYLRHNGVVIPPAADHHIVEIPDGAFGPPPSSPPPSTAATATTGDADGSSTSGGSSSAITTTTSLHDHPGASAAQPLQKPPPSAGDAWSLVAGFSDAHYTTTAAAAPPSGLTLTYDGHSSGGGGASDMHHMGYAARPPQRVWRMNVELFVENLTAKTTCLGRSPGIRPGDVDAAFWASVSDPASAL